MPLVTEEEQLRTASFQLTQVEVASYDDDRDVRQGERVARRQDLNSLLRLDRRRGRSRPPAPTPSEATSTIHFRFFICSFHLLHLFGGADSTSGGY